MNIFATDKCPIQSAQNLCDLHLGGKMLTESVQMIANCFSLDTLKSAPKTQKGNVRKYSYFNHPCSIWTRESLHNLDWLILHGIAMEEERIKRGYNPHFSIGFVNWAEKNIHLSNNPTGGLTKFAIAISDDKKCRQHSDFNSFDEIDKYRCYYVNDKEFAEWKYSNRPIWFNDPKYQA